MTFQTLTDTYFRPHQASTTWPRACIRTALQCAAAVAFVADLIVWPGVTLLSLLLLVAGYGLAYAASCALDILEAPLQVNRWLIAAGLAATTFGIAVIIATGAGVASVPLLIGAWFAARGKDGWFFLAGLSMMVLGLLLCTSHDNSTLTDTLVGVNALSSGVMVAALARVHPPATSPS